MTLAFIALGLMFVFKAAMAMAISYAISAAFAKKPKQNVPEAGNYPQQSALKAIPIPKVYGTRRVAGNIIWMKQTGTYEPYGSGISLPVKELVIAICEGPATVLRYWRDNRLQAGGRLHTFYDGDGTTGKWLKGGQWIDMGYTLAGQTGEPFINAENTCCVHILNERCDYSGNVVNYTFEVQSGYAGYPQLRSATVQANPGLSHDTPISSFADLKYWLQDQFVTGIHISQDPVYPTQCRIGLEYPVPFGNTMAIENTANYNGQYSSFLTMLDGYTYRWNHPYVGDEDGVGWRSAGIYSAYVGEKHYYLTNDIDASETAGPDYLNGYGWFPSMAFADYASNVSTLDGCGHKITGLYQSPNRTFQQGSNGQDAVGGFLYQPFSGIIANLTLENVTMYMEEGGGFASKPSNGTVTAAKFYNCHVTGSIYAVGDQVGNYTHAIGGFMDMTLATAAPKNTECYDCTANVQIDVANYHQIAAPRYVGGFIGTGYSSPGGYPKFYNCHAYGDVTVRGYQTTNGQYAGGFVGYPVLNCYFYDCSARGDVIGDKYVGGFSGGYYGYFARCYATGDVAANDPNNGIAGGFFGYATSYADAFDCYAWGNVAGGSNSYAGGFSGYLGDRTRCYSIGTVTGGSGKTGGFSGYGGGNSYCYWDTESSGLLTDGPSSLFANGKTTREMWTESTYQTWDFDTVWFMGNYFNTDCNPAFIVQDLLTHKRYGAGLDVSYIDADSIWAVADYCEENDVLISLVLKESKPVVDWIDHILAHCNGYRFWSEGKLKLGIFKDEEAVGDTLTQSDLVVDDSPNPAPPLTITTRERSETFNRIELSWSNRENMYDLSQVIAQDQVDQRVSGQVRIKQVNLDGICRATLAETIAYRMLYESMNRFNIYSFKLGYEHMLLEIGDVKTMTDGYLLNAQKMRFLSIEEEPNGRTLAIEAVEEKPLLYGSISTLAQAAWTPGDLICDDEIIYSDAVNVTVTPIYGDGTDTVALSDYAHLEVA
jgi:hypothetical protein